MEKIFFHTRGSGERSRGEAGGQRNEWHEIRSVRMTVTGAQVCKITERKVDKGKM